MDSLLEQIRATPKTSRFVTWESQLPPDVRAELDLVRAEWRAGNLPAHVTKTAVATKIAKHCRRLGLAGSTSTVSRWLEAPT